MELLAFFCLFVALLLLGAPIVLVLLVPAIVWVLLTPDVPVLIIGHQMFEAIAKFPLVAIPFFVLAGELMNTSSVTSRILNLSRALVGRTRGGLAQVNITASLFFAGMNGSAVADTATMGTVLIPDMVKRGYTPEYAAAVTAVGSTIGGIIPPSIAMIVLASAVSLPVAALFAGAIVPGLLVAAGLMLVARIQASRLNHESGEQAFSIVRVLHELKSAWLALLVPLVLVVGIFGGFFSSVEAGAVTSVVALIIGVVFYKDLSLAEIAGAFVRTAKLTSVIFFIIAAAGPFTWVLVRLGALDSLQMWLMAFSDSALLFPIMLLLVVLLAGMFMDATANIVVLGPLLVATCAAVGYSPLHAAIFVVVGFMIGTVTPPVGVCYFTANAIAKGKLEDTAKALMPFLAVEFIVLVLVLVVPALTLVLPGILL